LAQSGTGGESVTLGDRIRQANEQLLNKGDLEAVDSFFSPKYVNHGWPDQQGPQEIRQFIKALRTAFPDLRVEVEILLEHGDRVAWRRTHRGTFKADFNRMKATGRPVEWQSIVISRFANGRIVEEWGLENVAAQVQP
jgi:predicted ester cyclase